MRIIGIRHRIKKTSKNEARPTQICIISEDCAVKKFDLAEEQNELKFLLEDYQFGDQVAMVLGGSGDYFAYALSRRGEKISAKVFRLPPAKLKEHRPDEDKDNDAELLARLLRDEPTHFYEVTAREREIIQAAGVLDLRTEALAAKKACQQRLRQRAIGRIFTDPDGQYPEGALEDAIAEQQANSRILKVLKNEVEQYTRELDRLLDKMAVYQLFKEVEGCGPAISAPLILCIRDILRFDSAAKLKQFCGVAVMTDGTFARQRTGQNNNWRPECRQALYLLADQFNRRPKSKWGKILLAYKAKLRAKHPDVVCKTCGSKWEDCTSKKAHKRAYNDGHIHKMAQWRTVTKFIEWLWREWQRLEKKTAAAAAA